MIWLILYICGVLFWVGICGYVGARGEGIFLGVAWPITLIVLIISLPFVVMYELGEYFKNRGE